MTTRKEKRIRWNQLIQQLSKLEMQHHLNNDQEITTIHCPGCDICDQIQAIGRELAPETSNEDICTQVGLTPEKYKSMSKTTSDKDIAIELMVGLTSLSMWKKKHNLSHARPKLELTVDDYLKYRDQFMSNTEIAEKTGCNVRSLYKWVAKNGLNNRLGGIAK